MSTVNHNHEKSNLKKFKEFLQVIILFMVVTNGIPGLIEDLEVVVQILNEDNQTPTIALEG